MGCPYSEEELIKWDSVMNPMGEACYTCTDCDCDHWVGDCEKCDRFCENPKRDEFYGESLEKPASEVQKKEAE